MFTPDDLNKAITTALSTNQVQIPAGKTMAIMAVAHADGSVQGAIALKKGNHWTFGGEVDIHHGDVHGGVSLSSSW